MNHKNKTLFETIESAPNEIVIKKNKDAALLATASGVMVVYDDNTGDYFSRYPDGTVTCSNPQRCPKDLMKAAIEYMTAKFTNDGGGNEPDGKGKVRAIDRNLNSLKNNLVVKYATSESKLAEIDCCFNEIKAILSTINEYELNKTGGSKTTGNKTEQPTDDDVPSEKVDDENAADKKPADKKPYAKKPGDKPEDEIEERAKIRKAANAVYEHYKSKIESSDVVNKAMREFKLDLAAYLAKEGMMNKIDAEIFVEKSVKFNQSVVIAEAEVKLNKVAIGLYNMFGGFIQESVDELIESFDRNYSDWAEDWDEKCKEYPALAGVEFDEFLVAIQELGDAGDMIYQCSVNMDTMKKLAAKLGKDVNESKKHRSGRVVKEAANIKMVDIRKTIANIDPKYDNSTTLPVLNKFLKDIHSEINTNDNDQWLGISADLDANVSTDDAGLWFVTIYPVVNGNTDTSKVIAHAALSFKG